MKRARCGMKTTREPLLSDVDRFCLRLAWLALGGPLPEPRKPERDAEADREAAAELGIDVGDVIDTTAL